MKFGVTSVLGAAAILSLTAGASASMSEFCFTIRASAMVGGQMQFATYEVRSDSDAVYYDPPSQTYGWELTSPLHLVSAEGTTLAILDSASILAIEDPVVSVNFSVTAGAVQTAFDITSTQLNFGALSDSVTGHASASFTANDDSGDGFVQVSPIGVFPNNKLYAARYNNTGTLDGTDFGGGLLNGQTGQFIVGDAGNVPLQAIPGVITNMQAGFQFSLSSGDQAAGTSTFTIIPAPGAAALLGLGGLLASRRRR